MARCSRIGYPAPIGPSPSAVRHISVTSSLGSSDRVIAQGRSENAHRSHRETRLKVRVLSCAGPCSQLLYTSLFAHIHRYTYSNYHRTDDRLCWRGHTGPSSDQVHIPWSLDALGLFCAARKLESPYVEVLTHDTCAHISHHTQSAVSSHDQHRTAAFVRAVVRANE